MANQRSDAVLENPRQVFVISGPSGVGKNTVADQLCARGRAVRAVTATTRAPRRGEEDGTDYYFVGDDEFRRWINEGGLIEHARYVGHYYGTPYASVNEAAATGRAVLLTIDVRGGLAVKERWPGACLIFLEPPSEEELVRRLRARGDVDEAAVRDRVQRARQEMGVRSEYDYRVVNDDLDRAVDQVARIIEVWRGGEKRGNDS